MCQLCLQPTALLPNGACVRCGLEPPNDPSYAVQVIAAYTQRSKFAGLTGPLEGVEFATAGAMPESLNQPVGP